MTLVLFRTRRLTPSFSLAHSSRRRVRKSTSVTQEESPMWQQLGSPTHDSQILLRHCFLLTSKIHLWHGSQHLPEHFNKGAHAVVTNCNSRLRYRFALGKHFKRGEQPCLLSPTAKRHTCLSGKRIILGVRPASRRMSTKVRIFIEHLEKTFVLCSQFNPRPS